MRYPLVIFDFDGTLADSFPWVLRTVDEVAGVIRRSAAFSSRAQAESVSFQRRSRLVMMPSKVLCVGSERAPFTHRMVFTLTGDDAGDAPTKMIAAPLSRVAAMAADATAMSMAASPAMTMMTAAAVRPPRGRMAVRGSGTNMVAL